jgi:hypothetical protein
MEVVEGASGTQLAQAWRAQTQLAGAWLGGRFRLDERISVEDHISGPSSRAADGLSLWTATDQLLDRPVTIYLLAAGREVPGDLVEAARAAAKVSDPRLATIYDTDFTAGCPFIVSESAPGTPLEDLVRSGLPAPALAAAMIADAADAVAVAHQAGVPHLRLTPRSLRWDNSSGLKITGLGLDAALSGPALDESGDDPGGADVKALGRMLYALLTGCWQGLDAAALPPAPGYKGQVCTPRQVRGEVPAILDAITYQALRGQAPDAPARPLTAAGLAMALRGVQRPSIRLVDAPDVNAREPAQLLERGARGERGARPRAPRARHARAREGLLHRTTLLRPAV